MTTSSLGKKLLIAAVVAIVALGGYKLLHEPDTRSSGEKIGDAIDALPSGADKAVRQLEDRTPADKLQDAAQDAGDDLKKATNQ